MAIMNKEELARDVAAKSGLEISWRKCHKKFENVCAAFHSNLPSNGNPY
mgnify:CR=1 FL=1